MHHMNDQYDQDLNNEQLINSIDLFDLILHKDYLLHFDQSKIIFIFIY